MGAGVLGIACNPGELPASAIPDHARLRARSLRLQMDVISVAADQCDLWPGAGLAGGANRSDRSHQRLARPNTKASSLEPAQCARGSTGYDFDRCFNLRRIVCSQPAASATNKSRIRHEEHAVNFDSELLLAKAIIGELPQETFIGIVSDYREASEAMLADELLQPVLHSYTVESLVEMAGSCDLEIILPCLNQFDKAEQKYSWNVEFQNPVLREAYESLPDVKRWQVTNLLLRERSPQLWFYFQRTDSSYKRKSEKEVCEEFLNTTFVRSSTTQSSFIRKSDQSYRLLPKPISFPVKPADNLVKRIVDAVDGRGRMMEIFKDNLEKCERYSNLDFKIQKVK